MRLKCFSSDLLWMSPCTWCYSTLFCSAEMIFLYGSVHILQGSLYGPLVCEVMLWENVHSTSIKSLQNYNKARSACIPLGMGCICGGRAGAQTHCSDVIISTMASQIFSLTVVYSTVYSGADQRKHQSSVSLASVRGIHRWPVNSPHKEPATRKMSPFDKVVMILPDHRCLLTEWPRPSEAFVRL